MTSDKHIKIVSVLFGIAIMVMSSVLMGIPGLLLGAIVGIFGTVTMVEWLNKRKPENRRRIRRMMRNEGVG